MKHLLGRIVVLAILAITINGFVRAQVAGQLDRTFGDNGLVKVQLGTLQTPGGLVVQPDRKIVVAGVLSQTGDYFNKFFIARYNPNGTPDPTFGTNGVTVTPLGTLNSAFGSGLVRQPDGKLVAVGTVCYTVSDCDVVAVRYGTNGLLDTTFGSGGISYVNAFNGEPDYSMSETINDVAIHPNGSIIAVGEVRLPGRSAILLAFFDSAGAGSFVNSEISPDGVNYQSMGHSVTVLKNGKIMVGGSYYLSSFLARYDFAGNPDRTFAAPRGSVARDFGAEGSRIGKIVELPDGKLLTVGGRFSPGIALPTIGRFNPDGSFDSSFGDDGKVFPAFGNSLKSLITDYNAKFYVGCADFCTAARYNANGILDQSFGNSGLAPINENSTFQSGQFMALQNDGKIVAAGYVTNAAYVSVVRYRSNPLYKRRYGH